MRDASHEDHIVRWANYVKTHADWKTQHTRFINAQIEKAREVLERIRTTPGGEEKIQALRKLREEKRS